VGNVKVVLLGYSGLPRPTHRAFGQRIREVCEESGRRVVFVASGDLSHRLTPNAPAGYDPQGKVFDEEVVAGLAAADWDRIRALPSELIDRAGVCGYLSILTLAGAMGDQVENNVLSYQGPFGVGYAVATVRPDENGGPPPMMKTPDENATGLHLTPDNVAPDVLIRGEPAARPDSALVDSQLVELPAGDLGQQLLALARASLETYVRDRRHPRLPTDLPLGLQVRQSCFVTLRAGGQLRGCVGTIAPVRLNLAAEVVDNAIGAGTRDYRFVAITEQELGALAYSVDLLSPMEPVPDMSGMDPSVYGMVVTQDERVGVLLPGIPEVTDVQRQFDVCCQKAGISSPENTRLFRFTVTRYAEEGAEH
jgi:AmmeMemoRadiSam system protein A